MSRFASSMKWLRTRTSPRAMATGVAVSGAVSAGAFACALSGADGAARHAKRSVAKNVRESRGSSMGADGRRRCRVLHGPGREASRAVSSVANATNGRCARVQPARYRPRTMRSTRRSFLGACSAAAVAAGLPRVASATPRADLKWIDVADFPIEGRAFADRKAPFDRLPMRAEGVVRKEVWDLSRDSAGMCVRFATASPEIHVRYRLSSKSIA